MKSVGRKLGWCAPLAIMGALTLLCAQAGRTQTAPKETFPQWERDSGVGINNPPFPTPLFNRYLALWEYYTGADTTRFNLWTNLGDPLNDFDNYTTYYRQATNGDITYQAPWGSQLFSSQRPTPIVFNADGSTSGDDRPTANVLTLHVEDPTNTANNGFTDYLYPEEGSQEFFPGRVWLANDQGYFAPYRFPAGGGTAGGIQLEVTQKTEFARDMLRIEVSITNTGTTTRRVGARMLLDPWVDNGSVYLPETQRRLTYETEFRNAFVPTQWQMFDDGTGANANYIAKGYLGGRETGATPPSRVIFGNTLDMYPFVLAKGQYDWQTRPDFELRIADIGLLMYWDPVSIPAGQTRSFITYGGMGVADHGMSDAYIATHVGKPNPQGAGIQGFVGAVQTPFALPLVSGAADVDATGSPLSYNVDAYYQNEFLYASNGAFAFITLPDGLQFPGGPTSQRTQLPLGNAGAVGSNNDETSGQWKVQATGIEAGLLPINVTFGNAFQDSAHVVRMINVPQGNLYQLDDNWRMVTFPFTFTAQQDDPATALGLPPGTQFQIVRYNPASTAANPYEIVTRIEPGKSYWVRMLGTGVTFTRLQNAQPVRMGSTDPTGNNSLFTTPVQRGWNQVGDPSPYAISVRDMKFFTLAQGNGQLITYDQAVSQGWIRPTFYVYNRKTGAYEKLTRDSIVQPGQGVWIYSTDDRVVAWPAPVGPQLAFQ